MFGTESRIYFHLELLTCPLEHALYRPSPNPTTTIPSRPPTHQLDTPAHPIPLPPPHSFLPCFTARKNQLAAPHSRLAYRLTAHRSFLLSPTTFLALTSNSLCSLSSCLLAHSCPICIPIIPIHKNPIIAFPAAKTRTDSVRSASVTGNSRGGGVGRIE